MEALPRSVLSKIRKLIFDFLWNEHQDKHRFHLCSWEVISRPKRNGGWGIRNLNLFNLALISVTLWCILTQKSLWHSVIRDKYLHSSSLSNWLRRPLHCTSAASRIWLSLLRALPVILHWITWNPGNETLIKIGCDRILGMGTKSFLSEELLTALSLNQITYLSQASKAAHVPLYNQDRWISSIELGLGGDLATEWSSYTNRPVWRGDNTIRF
jgi:hypothetical protein